jgi:hypothetical protein
VTSTCGEFGKRRESIDVALRLVVLDAIPVNGNASIQTARQSVVRPDLASPDAPGSKGGM